MLVQVPHAAPELCRYRQVAGLVQGGGVRAEVVGRAALLRGHQRCVGSVECPRLQGALPVDAVTHNVFILHPRLAAGVRPTCAGMDFQIGQIRQALRDNSVRDDTLVFFTADKCAPRSTPHTWDLGVLFRRGVPGKLPCKAVMQLSTDTQISD